MHNPLALLDKVVLDGLISAGHAYFVRQTYARGNDPRMKEVLLLSPYLSKTAALAHYEAIAEDPRRYIYILEEQERLYRAAAQPSGYLVYIALLKERTWNPSYELAAKIKRYITSEAGWKPERRDDVQAFLFMQFGELFITLKLNQEEIKVPLSDIEKL